MILQELSRLYDRLLQDSNVEVCPPGFSMENISFKIVLTPEGELFDKEHPITDLRKQEGKKTLPVKIKVPKFDGKRSNGIKPYFLWDKTDYIIGIKRDPAIKDEIVEQYTPDKHDAFIKLIDAVVLATGFSHPAIEAVKKFCQNPENITILRTSKHWGDFLNTFVVFEVIGNSGSNIFEIEIINDLWLKYYNSFQNGPREKQGFCLVNGENSILAPLHPTIKKGVGGKNDIPLVSCNFDAAESYTKKKNANSQISVKAASYIAGAANYLLDNRTHNLRIANTQTLFWAESNPVFESFFAEIFDNQARPEESADLEAFLRSASLGKPPEDICDASRFFILGLAPNAARISIRFWYVDTVNNLAKNIGHHFRDLQLVKQRKEQLSFPDIWHLLIETAVMHKSENIAPNLSGPFLQSVLFASPYPENILTLLITRTRADQGNNKINYYRASLIKAILNRNHNKELTMALDRLRNDVPYNLGRLFALLEKIQEEASGGSLNTTIKDRYFSSASSTPRSVFPLIIRLDQNHLKKLKSSNTGLAVHREKELGEIYDKLTTFPATLKLEDQGVFAIGYYHQRQDFFKKKTEINDVEINPK